jgi:hypothetical protein
VIGIALAVIVVIGGIALRLWLDAQLAHRPRRRPASVVDDETRTPLRSTSCRRAAFTLPPPSVLRTLRRASGNLAPTPARPDGQGSAPQRLCGRRHAAGDPGARACAARSTVIREAAFAGIDPLATIPRHIVPGSRSRRDCRPADRRLRRGDGLPVFDLPMYAPLRDLSDELLIPNLNLIENNSITLLETNQKFIEAYMVGLNVEMGGELLWRGFPTDQRSTYFDQFWDVGGAKAPRADIDPISGWNDRKLGDATGAPVREQFVMLLRSALLRRYPNAIIYAAPAIASAGTRTPDLDPAHERFPAFRGEMRPDVSFFGFDITPAAAQGTDGTAGYYIVIQEHPTEPRFGLDVGTPAGSGTHVRVADGPPAGVASNVLTWGRNAAHVAGMLRRRPFRVAIHASMLVHHS